MKIPGEVKAVWSLDLQKVESPFMGFVVREETG